MFAYAHLILASITSSHLYSCFSTALDFWSWRVHRHQSKNSRGRRSLFIDLFWPSSPRHLSPYPERSSGPSLGQSRQRLFSGALRWSDERLGWWREGTLFQPRWAPSAPQHLYLAVQGSTEFGPAQALCAVLVQRCCLERSRHPVFTSVIWENAVDAFPVNTNG